MINIWTENLRAKLTAGELDFEDMRDHESERSDQHGTDDIDDLGIPEIMHRIRSRVGDSPVYLRRVSST